MIAVNDTKSNGPLQECEIWCVDVKVIFDYCKRGDKPRLDDIVKVYEDIIVKGNTIEELKVKAENKVKEKYNLHKIKTHKARFFVRKKTPMGTSLIKD